MWPPQEIGQAIDFILARMPVLEEIADIGRRSMCSVKENRQAALRLVVLFDRLKETEQPSDGTEYGDDMTETEFDQAVNGKPGDGREGTS